MKKWYNAYTGLPFRHLGNDPKTGIDCFNLCALILKQQLSANVKVLTSTFCNIVDADWYNKTNESFLDEFITTEDNLSLDLSKYPSGNYYLHFNSEGAVQGCGLEKVQKISNPSNVILHDRIHYLGFPF